MPTAWTFPAASALEAVATAKYNHCSYEDACPCVAGQNGYGLTNVGHGRCAIGSAVKAESSRNVLYVKHAQAAGVAESVSYTHLTLPTICSV